MSGGSRKTKIGRIDNEGARNVCFSKRRAGLFNKASELATLCGAESVLVVYSPAGNPYSFGSPGFKEVADRFLLGNAAAPTEPSGPDGQETSVIQQLSEERSQLSNQVWTEAEKKPQLVQLLNSMVQENQAFRFVYDMEGLGLDQLMQLEGSLALLGARVRMRISEILMRGSASSTFNVAMTGENQFGPRGDGLAYPGGPRFY